uniref:Uncharacterized protein n=1 Tax=Poecilia reticulata TaxID=8081 RepID=A0A3P9PN27_POERE
MKKQFNRMKQLANQTVGRLVKFSWTEPEPGPLGLFIIERRMELMRVVSHNTHKKMVSCLQGHIGAEAEKRHVSKNLLNLPLLSVSASVFHA